MNIKSAVGERVIGLILIVLILLGAGILWNRNKETTPITITTEQESTQDAAVSETSDTVLVDVEGAVADPGVYTLPMGARVEDAITAAGGLTEAADIDTFGMSRAAKVIDGQLISIPRKGASSPSGSAELSASGCVNINTATLAQLDSLPQIGEVRAQKIIDRRPYSDLNELISDKIITTSIFEEIREQICL